MPTMYNCSKATDPRPYVSLDAMWTTFSDLAHNKTPVVNGENFFLCISSTGARSFAPSGPQARRSWARPGSSAVPVASVAVGIDSYSHCQAHQ